MVVTFNVLLLINFILLPTCYLTDDKPLRHKQNKISEKFKHKDTTEAIEVLNVTQSSNKPNRFDNAKAKNNLQKLKDFNPSGVSHKNPCSQLHCSRYKVCYLNIQGIPMCRCPNIYACKGSNKQQVCSEEDKTYKNQCFLRVEECRQNKRLKAKHKGACKVKPELDNSVQTKSSDPHSNHVMHSEPIEIEKTRSSLKKNAGKRFRARRNKKQKYITN